MKLVKQSRPAKIRFLFLVIWFLALQGCAFVNATGRAYEGAGKGLKTAANETKHGTIPQRMINFVGTVSEGLGSAIVEGVQEDRNITDQHSDAKLKGKQWDK